MNLSQIDKCDKSWVDAILQVLLTRNNENEELNISTGATLDIKKSPEKTYCEAKHNLDSGSDLVSCAACETW